MKSNSAVFFLATLFFIATGCGSNVIVDQSRGKKVAQLDDSQMKCCDNLILYEEIVYESKMKNFPFTGVCNDTSGGRPSVRNYIDGKADGEFIWYDSIGNLISKEYYRVGERVKKWFAFHENGEVLMEVNYIDGLENGTYKQYYNNGVVQVIGYYLNGSESGTWTLYDMKGDIDSTIVFNPEQNVLEL